MEDEMIDYGFEEDSVREKLKAAREILLFKLLTFRDVWFEISFSKFV